MSCKTKCYDNAGRVASDLGVAVVQSTNATISQCSPCATDVNTGGALVGTYYEVVLDDPTTDGIFPVAPSAANPMPDLRFQAASNSTGTGSNVNILAGDYTGVALTGGGTVTISGGAATVAGSGGDVLLTGGTSAAGQAGSVNLSGGEAQASGQVPGNVFLRAGQNSSDALDGSIVFDTVHGSIHVMQTNTTIPTTSIGTVTAGSSDMFGEWTGATFGPASVTITFHQPYSVAPFVLVSSETSDSLSVLVTVLPSGFDVTPAPGSILTKFVWHTMGIA